MLTTLNEIVQPLVDKKKEEVTNTEEKHTDLVAKVKEKYWSVFGSIEWHA